MKVLDPGHLYELAILDGNDDFGGNVLCFVKREGEGFPGNVGHYPGTTLQEVLRACADRIDYLNRQKPCAENDAIAGLLRTSIFLLENRAARNHGHFLKMESMARFMQAPACAECLHVACEKHEVKP